MKCTCCGAQLPEGASVCRFCGEPAPVQPGAKKAEAPKAAPVQPDHIYTGNFNRGTTAPTSFKSEKNRLVLLLLCIFLGCWGVHRFYQGKVGTGVLFLLTRGFGRIGWIIDIITIATGNVTDGDGRPICW